MSDRPYFATPLEDVRRKSMAGAGWTTILHIGARLIELVFTIILARLLSPTEFGVVAAAMVFIQFARLFVEIGVGAALVQIPDLTLYDVRTAGALVALSSILFFAVAQLSAPLVAGFFGVAEVEGIVRVLAFMFLFQAIGMTPESLLIRRLNAPRVMAAEAAAKILGFGAVGAACAAAGLGYWSLAIGALAETLIKAAALQAMARPPLAPMLHGPSVRRLLGKGLGFSISRILNFAALTGDKVIAGRVLGPAALGLYGRAYSLMSLPTDLYGRIAERIVFPALASLQDDPGRLRRAYLAGTSLTATIGLPLSVILVMLAPELIVVLFGERWVGAVGPFAILATAAYFRLGARISGSLLRATGSLRTLVLIQTTYASMIVAGCLLAAAHGLIQLAWAVTGSVCVFYLLISLFACRRTATPVAAFAKAHWHGALLSTVTGAAIIPLILILRRAEAPDAAILLSSAAVIACIGAALAAFAPRWLLGEAAARVANDIRGIAVRILLKRRARALPIDAKGGVS